MNVPGPDATNRTIFLSPEQKHKGIISCRRYQIQRKKKKEKGFCPVSLISLARSRARVQKKKKRSREIKRMGVWMVA